MSPSARPSGPSRLLQRVLLAAVLVGVAFLTARSAGIFKGPPAEDRVAWQPIAEAAAAARTAGKPILYDFTAAWCPPCQMMKREVFSDRKSAETIGRLFVPVQVLDRSREDGANPPEVTALQARFAVEAFPTLVIAAPDGGQPVIIEGYGGREWLMQALADAGMRVGLAMREGPRPEGAAPAR